MPRMSESSKSLAADLADRISRLVAAAKKEGREEALLEVRSLVGGTVGAKRGPGRPRKAAAAAPARKPRKKRKNPWAALSPADRLARVNAIRKGRGLPLKEKL